MQLVLSKYFLKLSVLKSSGYWVVQIASEDHVAIVNIEITPPCWFYCTTDVSAII